MGRRPGSRFKYVVGGEDLKRFDLIAYGARIEDPWIILDVYGIRDLLVAGLSVPTSIYSDSISGGQTLIARATPEQVARLSALRYNPGYPSGIPAELRSSLLATAGRFSG